MYHDCICNYCEHLCIMVTQIGSFKAKVINHMIVFYLFRNIKLKRKPPRWSWYSYRCSAEKCEKLDLASTSEVLTLSVAREKLGAKFFTLFWDCDFFAVGHGAIAGKRGGYEMDANGFYGDTFSGWALSFAHWA